MLDGRQEGDHLQAWILRISRVEGSLSEETLSEKGRERMLDLSAREQGGADDFADGQGLREGGVGQTEDAIGG